MTNDEARFILRAYRPDGGDAADPMMAQALEQARRDPALHAWFERERAHDTEAARRLRGIAPPDGLREAILAGLTMSAPPVPAAWWRRPASLALAAMFTVLLVAAAWLWRPTAGPSVLTVAGLAQFAQAEAAGAHAEPGVHADQLGDFGRWLLDPANHLGGGIPIDLGRLRADGCRVVTIAGHEVFEVCFPREGRWHHLYIARRGDIEPGVVDGPRLVLTEPDGASAVSWRDRDLVYVLSAQADPAALLALL